MEKNNLMDLFETQKYIINRKHEWYVPVEVKDKVSRLVQKYNERAVRMKYNDSLLYFDSSSSILRGVFVPKKEKISFFENIHEKGKNADLSGDIMSILKLCHKVCPQCNTPVPALSKICPECGFHFLQDTEEEQKKNGGKGVNIPVTKNKEDEKGISYEFSDTYNLIELPSGITYRDTILSHFEKFIALQKEKPMEEKICFLALDLTRIDAEEEENMANDDPRWGINYFDIQNIVFSKYNNWMPLFEDKINSETPQIFIIIKDLNTDLLKRVAMVAKRFGISYAIENGLGKYDTEYSRIVFSFDDDTEMATNFICFVATHIFSVPKDVPVSINIHSYQSKAKAKKEYKKNNTFSTKNYVKGAMYLLKKKITGK